MGFFFLWKQQCRSNLDMSFSLACTKWETLQFQNRDHQKIFHPKEIWENTSFINQEQISHQTQHFYARRHKESSLSTFQLQWWDKDHSPPVKWKNTSVPHRNAGTKAAHQTRERRGECACLPWPWAGLGAQTSSARKTSRHQPSVLSLTACILSYAWVPTWCCCLHTYKRGRNAVWSSHTNPWRSLRVWKYGGRAPGCGLCLGVCVRLWGGKLSEKEKQRGNGGGGMHFESQEHRNEQTVRTLWQDDRQPVVSTSSAPLSGLIKQHNHKDLSSPVTSLQRFSVALYWWMWQLLAWV